MWKRIGTMSNQKAVKTEQEDTYRDGNMMRPPKMPPRGHVVSCPYRSNPLSASEKRSTENEWSVAVRRLLCSAPQNEAISSRLMVVQSVRVVNISMLDRPHVQSILVHGDLRTVKH
jgi:hypothetical protein